jgi:lysophospholipase L1-like esterase
MWSRRPSWVLAFAGLGLSCASGGGGDTAATAGDAGASRGAANSGGASTGGGANPASGDPASGAAADGVNTDLGLAPPAAPGSNAPDAGPPGAAPGPALVGAGAPLTVHLAGDSIVQTYADTASPLDQAGWGQMLHEWFDAAVAIDNRAIGGRTARRFIDEGHLDEVSAALQPGDYLLIEFGTNDGNRTATYTIGSQTIPYFLDPATDFKAYLTRYIDAARSREAIPVLVTPTPRNSAYCTGGNGTGAHANAMLELGRDTGVTVVDLNARAVEYLRAICPAPSPEDFFLLRPDGTVDGTHFQERGARVLAGFVAEGLRVLPPFAAHFGAP